MRVWSLNFRRTIPRPENGSNAEEQPHHASRRIVAVGTQSVKGRVAGSVPGQERRTACRNKMKALEKACPALGFARGWLAGADDSRNTLEVGRDFNVAPLELLRMRRLEVFEQTADAFGDSAADLHY